MKLHFAAFRSCCLCSLGELFLKRCAHTAVGGAVEGEERFGKLPVVESVGQDDCADEFLELAFVGEFSRRFTVESGCHLAELVVESEVLDVVDELFHIAACGGKVAVAVNKGEQCLEHARCCA